MSNTDLILGFLGEIYPDKFCDDCLSSELQIFPRQQINIICRGLVTKKMLVRQDDTCASCGKKKKVNRLTSEQNILIQNSQGKEGKRKVIKFEEELDLQEIRRKIISICHDIWVDNIPEVQPRELSLKINVLRNKGLIPSHQANMMLTLNGLRNSFEYERLIIDEEEKAIALNAWKIIEKWNLNYQKNKEKNVQAHQNNFKTRIL